MPYELPDHVVGHLISVLGIPPENVDAETRESVTRTLTSEVQIAAHASLANTLKAARAETMDCLHGPVRLPTPGDPGRSAGLDARLAGPLALVRALIAEIERLRAQTPTEPAAEPEVQPFTEPIPAPAVPDDDPLAAIAGPFGRPDPRAVRAESLHLTRHGGKDCDWDPEEPLDEGCPTRYQSYTNIYGLPRGHSFDENPVEVVSPTHPAVTGEEPIPADETKAEKVARYTETLDFVLSPEWLPWFEYHRPDLMARLRAAVKKGFEHQEAARATTATTSAKPVQIDPANAPAPPHRHRNDHDPAQFVSECCACQHQSGVRLYVDESCPTCIAQRDGYRAYTLVEWAVKHPSGIVEERVPEGMARRHVAAHADMTLMARERIKTPDVVGAYVEVPVERAEP
jgi:hypothetical protein